MPKLAFNNVAGPWHTNDFKSVSLTSVSWEGSSRVLAFVFFGHVNIDFDGSPTAYGPTGPGPPTATVQPVNPPPDDCLKNGGNPSDGYFGVAAMAPTDPLVLDGTVLIDQDAPKFLGKFPIVQQARNHDPKPNYYVSKSSHKHGPFHLQNSYIDSAEIAYGALDARLLDWESVSATTDFAFGMTRTWRVCSIMSMAVDRNSLWASVPTRSQRTWRVTRVAGTPCTWNNNFPVSFMVFPRSGDMHFDAVKGVEIGFGIMERHENLIRNALRPRMAELSRAENARDLALLMAFNEGLPTTAPNGKMRLDAYLKKRGATRHISSIL